MSRQLLNRLPFAACLALAAVTGLMNFGSTRDMVVVRDAGMSSGASVAAMKGADAVLDGEKFGDPILDELKFGDPILDATKLGELSADWSL